MVTTKSPTPHDIIADILARLRAAAARNQGILTTDVAAAVEKEVREDWGGDRVFIASAKGRDHSQRNSRIMRDYLQGERLALLGRRYQLSERRILQIIKSK